MKQDIASRSQPILAPKSAIGMAKISAARQSGAELLTLNERGLSYSEIGRMRGISRNAVAGAIHRYRVYSEPGPRKPFRNEQRAREAVALANSIGLMAAARSLRIDGGQLCRWRQKLRLIEGAA